MKKKKRLSGIERRWFVNNVGVIMLLVAACVLGVVFSMAAYYDTNLRSGLENKAKTTTDFFSNYISQSYKEYYQSCIKFAQTFEEKDRLELQFISANGKLVASSYGKFAGRSPSTPEIQQAIDSQQIRHYKGRNPLTGERILAVSSPMIYTNGEVIGVLRYVKEQDPSILTKTGFMVGLGETDAQISALMDDVLAVGCDILTIGQYLQPSEAHWRLARYAAPEDFARYKQLALAKGFRHVASAPLARSSYRAWEALEDTHDLY